MGRRLDWDIQNRRQKAGKSDTTNRRLERYADKILENADKKTVKNKKEYVQPEITWPIYVTKADRKGNLRTIVFNSREEADRAGYTWIGRPSSSTIKFS